MTIGKRSGKRVYSGKVINLDVDTVEFPDGSTGQLEIFRHPGASAVVPFLSDPRGPDPQILLIRQYRYAADGFIYEIPAGRLDAGEDPAACAARELKEETGCTAGKLEHLYTMFTTPGFTDEKIHLFLATELTRGDAARESDEFLTLEPMGLERALQMIRKGEIQDGKTATAILFASLLSSRA
jgi:ADP-ribose pyrophosphatase